MASRNGQACALGCGIAAGLGIILILLLAVVGVVINAALWNHEQTMNRIREEAPPPPPPPADIERPGDASTPESKQAEEEAPEPDLTVIRARLEREIYREQSDSGRLYRIHRLTYENGTLILWLDLQFKPDSQAFLREEAQAWTELMLHTKCGEEYVREMSVKVRTSMVTVVGPDELILHGAYRVYSLPNTAGTWTPRGEVKFTIGARLR